MEGPLLRLNITAKVLIALQGYMLDPVWGNDACHVAMRDKAYVEREREREPQKCWDPPPPYNFLLNGQRDVFLKRGARLRPPGNLTLWKNIFLSPNISMGKGAICSDVGKKTQSRSQWGPLLCGTSRGVWGTPQPEQRGPGNQRRVTNSSPHCLRYRIPEICNAPLFIFKPLTRENLWKCIVLAGV